MTLHDAAFYAWGAGFFASWIGGGNFLVRRFLCRREGGLSSWDAYSAPNWLSVPILVAGVALIVCSGVLAGADALL